MSPSSRGASASLRLRARGPVAVATFVPLAGALALFASDRAATAATPRAVGVAVVAEGDTVDVTWPLAQEVYARTSLRPASLDEARARVLAGEAPAPTAPQSIRDLAETRAALHGDDAPTRHLLASLAGELHVRALVVVDVPAPPPPAPATIGTAAPSSPDVADGGAAASELAPAPALAPPARRAPVAHVFLAESGTFDAATYTPDDAPTISWRAAVTSLDRSYGVKAAPAPLAANPNPSPSHAPAPAREGKEPSRPFYTSPWFWGAIGAAAFGATAIYFATRDNGDGTIHLQMQVPK